MAASLCTHYTRGERQTALARKTESLERESRQKAAEGVSTHAD